MSSLKNRNNLFRVIDSHIIAEQKKEKKNLEYYLGIIEENEKKFINIYNNLIEKLTDTEGELSEIYEEIDITKTEIKNQKKKYRKIKDTIKALELWEPNLYRSMKNRYEQLNELDEQLKFMLNAEELEKEKGKNEDELLYERNIFKILENKLDDLKQHIKELKQTNDDMKKENKKYKNIMTDIRDLLLRRKNNQNIIAKIKKEIEQKQEFLNTDTLIDRFKKLRTTSPITTNLISLSSPINSKSKTLKRASPVDIKDQDIRKSPKLKGGKKQKNKKTKRKNRKINKKKTIRKKM